MRTRHQKPRVGIVGAGFAGLRCAEVLLRNGIEVVILESKGRVGGRVCQSIVDGHAIDLGPNWIHGTEQNPIYEIAKKTDTVYHSWDHGRTRVIDKNDVEMDHHRAEELSTAMWDVVAKAYEFSGKHGSDIPASRGLVDFLKCEGREHLREHFQKIRDKDRSSEFPKDTIEADVNDTVRLADMWGGFVGTEYERQSLRFFWLEEMLDGGKTPLSFSYPNQI